MKKEFRKELFCKGLATALSLDSVKNFITNEFETLLKKDAAEDKTLKEVDLVESLSL